MSPESYVSYNAGQENAPEPTTPEQNAADRAAAREPGAVRTTGDGRIVTEGPVSATSGRSNAEAAQAPLASLKSKVHGVSVTPEQAAKNPQNTLIFIDGMWDTVAAAMSAGQVVERDGKLTVLSAQEQKAIEEAVNQQQSPPVPQEHAAVLSDSTRNNLGYISQEFGDAAVVSIATHLAQNKNVPPVLMQDMASRSGKEPAEVLDIISRAHADFTLATMKVLEREGIPASMGAAFAEWASRGRTADQYNAAFVEMALTNDTRAVAALAREFRTEHAGRLKGRDFHGRTIKSTDGQPSIVRVWQDDSSVALIEIKGHGTMRVEDAYAQKLIDVTDE